MGIITTHEPENPIAQTVFAQLVGALEHFFKCILGIIIPTDEVIFFRGVEITQSIIEGEMLGNELITKWDAHPKGADLP